MEEKDKAYGDMQRLCKKSVGALIKMSNEYGTRIEDLYGEFTTILEDAIHAYNKALAESGG